MTKFDIIKMIINIIKEYGYDGSFGIYHVSDCIIVSMVSNNHSVSKVILMDEIKLCHDPEYKIGSIINNMTNEMEE